MNRLTVTAADLDADADVDALEGSWAGLVTHVRAHGSQLVVLPEMPFAPWLAASTDVDPDRWEESVATHQRWLARLDELHAEAVVTTLPVVEADRRYNEAIVWTAAHGIVARRRKTFLPDEAGFREASWYERGPVSFPVVSTPVVELGVMVCTELWFPEYGRALGREGARLLAVPRATPAASVSRWEAGARTVASIAGSFVVSVNRAGSAQGDDGRGPRFDGGSTIVDPEGDVLARTTPTTPFATATLDLDLAEVARSTYPRYVDDRIR
jgi:N-carbamoylputrescine amidase